MTLWLVRAGRHGEQEALFREREIIAIGFEREVDLSTVTLDDLKSLLQQKYPAWSPQRIAASAGQMWTFAHTMEKGHWVVVPFKTKGTISVAEIVGDYQHTPDDHSHVRKIRWIEQDIPRSDFDTDLRNSFGGLRTIYQISRNDAEKRIRKMLNSGGHPSHSDPNHDTEGPIDIEEEAAVQVEKLIKKVFPEHEMERLVEAILKAQGYTVYHSPKGPDKGIDLLAAPGPLGFGMPRLCVQVKSGGREIDGPTFRQIDGAMNRAQADQGLFVSWGGFNKEVEREVASQFFKVRLWDRKKLIDQVLEHYDKLDSDIKVELPLKRIWIVIPEPEE